MSSGEGLGGAVFGSKGPASASSSSKTSFLNVCSCLTAAARSFRAALLSACLGSGGLRTASSSSPAALAPMAPMAPMAPPLPAPRRPRPAPTCWPEEPTSRRPRRRASGPRGTWGASGAGAVLLWDCTRHRCVLLLKCSTLDQQLHRVQCGHQVGPLISSQSLSSMKGSLRHSSGTPASRGSLASGISGGTGLALLISGRSGSEAR
mmetsp:Transcript_2065/g.5669  ORF Transcript_2065/g.5669 Transcript_2065/m.5669 type:complete len:206 (+) Transcript_2065:195-812(+)